MRKSGCTPPAKPTQNNFEKSQPADLDTQSPLDQYRSLDTSVKMPQEIGDIKKVRIGPLTSFYSLDNVLTILA